MEIDLANAGTELLPDPGIVRTQVCVVGGGIAGLVLASHLASLGVDLVLLEAGGRRSTLTPSAECDVELTGEAHHGSREGRPNGLGGSSAVWGGQLLPMLAGAAWPVPEAELSSLSPMIEKLLGTDGLAFDAAAFLAAQHRPLMPMLEQMPQLVARMSKFAPFAARNLGRSLGEQLRHHPRVRQVLHARVTELRMAEEGRVGSILLRTPAGGELAIEADRVVLAAGTVETCRLLLLSRLSQGADGERGIGNGFGQVGRGFHDHLTVEVARFKGEAHDHAVRLFRPWIVGGLRGTLHGIKLEAGEELRRRLGLNFALAHVTFQEPESSGLAAVRSVLKARQQGARGSAIDQQGDARASGVNWRGLPIALQDTWRLHSDAKRFGRRYVSPGVRVGLRVNVAQEVPGTSWIGLSERKDRWGQPLPRVHWEHTPADLRTMRLFADQLRCALRGIGFPELQWNAEVLPRPDKGNKEGKEGWQELDRPLPGLEDARHAMGGARMGSDPQTSVVDLNLKVHGVDNLYIASAAVFPDGRPQLPTLTLMALALRLADHLRSKVQAS